MVAAKLPFVICPRIRPGCRETPFPSTSAAMSALTLDMLQVTSMRFSGGTDCQRDPGSQVEYSNVGVGLLGHALALRAGMSYEDLLRRRILEPLGMTNTGITLSAEQNARRATGHNPRLLPVPPWTGGVIAPTGGISSTAADVLKFAAAVLDPKSPLKAAFAADDFR